MENQKHLSLLEKIKKLLAIGEDIRGNVNESQIALLKAQKLMAEHGISSSDVFDTNISSNDVEDNSISGYKNLEWWNGCLGVIIAENFRCFCYINHKKYSNKILKSINFVGLKEDVKVSKEVFYYAIEMVEYYKDMYIRNYRINNPHRTDFKGIENTYINGYLSGLKAKFEEQKEENKSKWGLILVRDEEVNSYIKKNLDLRKGTSSKIKSSNNMDHFNSGFEKGKNFNVIGGELE